MKNHKRLTNILIAGTLTALVLAVFLAFRGEGTAVAAADTGTDTPVVAAASSTDMTALQAQVETLQAQNEQLRATVTTLQEREAQYQQQIESANETINELSAQANGAFPGEGFAFPPPGRGEHSHDGFDFDSD